MTQTTTVYLARHGQTDWNKTGIRQGQADISRLTDEGKAQAQQLAQRFAELPLAALYSSDLTRARTTAEIVAQPHNLSIQTDVRLRERFGGPLDGKPTQWIREQYGDRYREIATLPDEQAVEEHVIPEMESDADMIRRLKGFLGEVVPSHQGESIAVVTHGGIVRSLLWMTGYGSLAELNQHRFENCGYVVFNSDGVAHTIADVIGYKPVN